MAGPVNIFATPDYKKADNESVSGSFATLNSATALPPAGFPAELQRAIWFIADGVAASGTITILRSTDGGVNKRSLTAGGTITNQFTFTNVTGNIIHEIVGGETVEDGLWYAQVTLTAGSITYKFEQ